MGPVIFERVSAPELPDTRPFAGNCRAERVFFEVSTPGAQQLQRFSGKFPTPGSREFLPASREVAGKIGRPTMMSAWSPKLVRSKGLSVVTQFSLTSGLFVVFSAGDARLADACALRDGNPPKGFPRPLEPSKRSGPGVTDNPRYAWLRGRKPRGGCPESRFGGCRSGPICTHQLS